jgi:hypothetical protein
MLLQVLRISITLMRILVQLFTSRRNRILKGYILSEHAYIVSVHGPPRIHFEPLKLLNFDFIADSDLPFHSNANPDPAFQNNADRSGSATATLVASAMTHFVNCGIRYSTKIKVENVVFYLFYMKNRILPQQQ